MSTRPGLFDLTGRVAVVTGSSQGIGRSIAEQMAVAGAKVVVSSRRADACAAVAAAIEADGGTAMAVPCDVASPSDCATLVDRTEAAWGHVDILVCNAALHPKPGPIADLPDTVFDAVLATNVKSNVWLTNRVCPGMAARRDGAIVVISSASAFRGTDGTAAYAMSKAADVQLVRNLTVEWGPYNVRANCVAPSVVMTDMVASLWRDPKRRATMATTFPLGRLGTPEDISGVVVALSSRAGAWISGQTILVDGGMMAASGRYA